MPVDPISLTQLLFMITKIVEGIIAFGKNASEAKQEISILSSELFALKGILEHVRASLDNSKPTGQLALLLPLPAITDTSDFANVLNTTEEFLKELSEQFLQPGREGLRATLQHVKFAWKKDDITKHILRLERVKSYFLFATVTDSLSVISLLVFRVRY